MKLLISLLIAVIFLAAWGNLPKEDHIIGGNNLTAEDATEVYNNLQKYSGVPGGIPPLVVLESREINAWITPENLTITTGMLYFIHNKDELAAVLGHEMGHYLLQHFDLPGDSRIHEANADKFGVYLMLRAGYDVCSAEGIWIRFDDRYGDPIITESHPSPAQRTWELDFPMCHGSV